MKEDDWEKEEMVTALWQLLYMLPQLHYLGYPSQLAPILQRHPKVDYLVRFNRGGRWIIQRGRRRIDESQEDALNPRCDDDESTISPAMWSLVLERAYEKREVSVIRGNG